MTVAELAKVSECDMKVKSAYNGKVLCHRFDPEKHKEIGEREVVSVWADQVIITAAFGNLTKAILGVYVNGAPEAFKANPF